MQHSTHRQLQSSTTALLPLPECVIIYVLFLVRNTAFHENELDTCVLASFLPRFLILFVLSSLCLPLSLPLMWLLSFSAHLSHSSLLRTVHLSHSCLPQKSTDCSLEGLFTSLLSQSRGCCVNQRGMKTPLASTISLLNCTSTTFNNQSGFSIVSFSFCFSTMLY